MLKKKKYHIAKLKKIMNEPKVRVKDRFYPTVSDCEEWFRTINYAVFDNVLDPFINIEIRRQRGIWACCNCHYNPGVINEQERNCSLSMNNWYSSKKAFVACVAHEMVHEYEWMIEKVDEDIALHGKTFTKWKPKMKTFGITL